MTGDYRDDILLREYALFPPPEDGYWRQRFMDEEDSHALSKAEAAAVVQRLERRCASLERAIIGGITVLGSAAAFLWGRG